MEVYLIRHTTPAIEKGICYGQSEIPLAATFESEWIHIREKLPSHIDYIFTSPLLRCRQLSVKLSVHFNVPFTEDPRLMEMNFGEWELMRWNDIDQQKLNRWMNNYKTEECPEGESYHNVLKRVKSFITDLPVHLNQQVLVVTHSGIIKCFDGIINKRDGMSLKVDYGAIHIFNINNQLNF